MEEPEKIAGAHESLSRHRPEKWLEGLGARLREQRMGLSLTMRDVERLTRELQDADPAAYYFVNRNALVDLEREGHPRLAQMQPGVVRALMTVLYGSLANFTARTGLDLRLSAVKAHWGDTRIPLWTESDGVIPHEMRARSDAQPTVMREVRGAMYALEVKSGAMRPTVFPGQVVWVSPGLGHEVGRLCLIYRAGVLGLAYALTGGEMATLQGAAFKLTGDEHIMGHVLGITGVIAASVFEVQDTQSGPQAVGCA